MNSTVGNSNNYILIYDTIGGKKVYNKVIKGLSYAYTLNHTLYFYGSDLWYGGYLKKITFAKNSSLGVFPPGQSTTNDPSKILGTTLGFSNVAKPDSSASFVYTAIAAYVPAFGNNARYNSSTQTWGSSQAYTYEHVDKTPTNVLTTYRYDYNVSDLTTNVPLFDVSTSNYNIIDGQNSLDDQSSYELTAVTLKNTLSGSFGGGAYINAVGLGGNADTSPTSITGTHSININKLKITKNQKPNTIYNKYIYMRIMVYTYLIMKFTCHLLQIKKISVALQHLL